MAEQQWIKDLKIGDEVAVDNSSAWIRDNYDISKVEKITPTGRVNLYNGLSYYPDGRQIGTSYGIKLKQITPEILECIKCQKLRYKIKGDKLVDMLDSSKLEILLSWQNELLKEIK
jgi:hypothetical protein